MKHLCYRRGIININNMVSRQNKYENMMTLMGNCYLEIIKKKIEYYRKKIYSVRYCIGNLHNFFYYMYQLEIRAI